MVRAKSDVEDQACPFGCEHGKYARMLHTKGERFARPGAVCLWLVGFHVPGSIQPFDAYCSSASGPSWCIL